MLKDVTSIFIILLFSFFLHAYSTLIFKTPNFFYSQLCSLGQVNPGSSQSFTCTTADPQQNIVRTGILLTQFTKPAFQYHQWSVSVSHTADPTSTFTFTVSLGSPASGMKMSYFLIIIKSQPVQKYADIINFSKFLLIKLKDWGSGTILDNNDNLNRSISQFHDLTTQTVFTSGSGVLAIPLMTSLKLLTKNSGGGLSHGTDLQWGIFANINSNTINITLQALDQTKIYGFQGIVILYNPTTINSAAATNSWNVGIFSATYTNPTSYSILTAVPTYGPRFNSKCLLGYQNIFYEGSHSINFAFTNNSFGNFISITFTTDSPTRKYGNVFCLGNGSQCGQSSSYFDKMDGQCYTSSTCPLPVPTSWTQANLCPICTQLICLKCTVSNRSNCQSCGPHSSIVDGACVCNTDYWEVTTPISTSSLGQWNGVANSLTECRYSCTLQMTGCVFNKCNTGTFCTECQSGYALNYVSLTDQNCFDCTTINNCLTCSSSQACLTCLPGYFVNSSSKCECSPTLSNLSDCQTCSSPTVCTQCVSSSYYLSSFDNLCYLCSVFDSHCSTCSSYMQCTLCVVGYGLKTNTDGSITCVLCSFAISNCDLCLTVISCTDCALDYGINSSQKCSTCISMMTACLQCQDSSTCLKCTPDTFLISGVCHYCNEIYQCKTCVYVPSLNNIDCVLCEDGYFINTNVSSGTHFCKPCSDLLRYCSLCDSIQCFACQPPYLIGTDKLCSQCINGFQYNNGFCTNITGCQNVIKDSITGKQTCIACVSQLHFLMDFNSKKCVCSQGFDEIVLSNFSHRCIPVCGDGIVLPQFEQCDDNNTQNSDGCDNQCKTQTDFDCGVEQPSQCTLHLNIHLIVFKYVYRILGENTGILSFLIEPRHPGLQKMEWQKIVKFNFFSSSAVDKSKLKFSYSAITGQLRVIVPYTQELQSTNLDSSFVLDPKHIVSNPSKFFLQNQLNGVNVPLIFESQLEISTHENINIITLLMISLLLLQFYVGSYSHKMIGLETIQVIQSIYFVRMVAGSSSTTLLNSINAIQYSVSGYHNAEFIYGSTKQIEMNLYGNTAQEFLIIDLKRYFLLNVNFSLIPVIIVVISLIVSLIRKYKARNEFVETKEQEKKDKYTEFRRSFQWVYDHFTFPYIMMFSLVSYFQSIELLQTPSKIDTYKSLENESFTTHIIMVYATVIIYCYEIFHSIEEYNKYRMTQKQRERVPKSLVEQLEHDENNPDRANYHPAYVLVYLLYYFILSLTMILSVLIPDFDYSLQISTVLAGLYLMLIIVWKPYHSSINVHNYFLNIYYGTYLIFLVFCYLFSKIEGLQKGIYVFFMYIITLLIGLVMIIGFIRIAVELKYRKALSNDSTILSYTKTQQKQKSKSKQESQLNKQLLNKKDLLVLNNEYAFDNQLIEIQKRMLSDTPKTIVNEKLMQNMRINPRKDYLVKKIRQNIQKQRQNIIIQDYIKKAVNNKEKVKKNVNNEEMINDVKQNKKKKRRKQLDDEKQQEVNDKDEIHQKNEDKLEYRQDIVDIIMDKKLVKEGIQKKQQQILKQIKNKLKKQLILLDQQ